jgi:nicotinate-nucleotide adenylyltransferase
MLATAYFFGTFNPIHWGHLAMAHTALQQFGLQRVVFIPSPQPPHRLHDADMAPAVDRLAMVRLATAPFGAFSVNAIEFDRTGPSYTVDTLVQLHPPDDTGLPIPVIMGYDAALSLPTWHRASELLQRCTFLVAPRPPAHTLSAAQATTTQPLPPDIRHHDLLLPPNALSASWLRQHLRQGQSVACWTPQAVANYIGWNGLYAH